MGVTVANAEQYFFPTEGFPEEEFRALPVRRRLPFCDLTDREITPPSFRNGRVAFTVRLFSCKLYLTFESVQNFARSGELARPKRGITPQVWACSIRKRNGLYEYALTAGGGEVKFAFRTAIARLRGIIPAAEYIRGTLARYRGQLRSVPAEEQARLHMTLPAEEERFPDANCFFFPYFDEARELGTLRKAEEPFYALWRLYAAISEGEIEGESDDKSDWRLETGGYLRYFRECGYDLYPLLQQYAPRWAENFSEARQAYRANDLERLALVTIKHLAGKWYPCEGAAAMRYADLIALSEYSETPQGRDGKACEQAYEHEFVRALCRAAQGARERAIN